MKLSTILPAALLALLPLAACYASAPESAEEVPVGEAPAAVGADACGGTCVAPQICGLGCLDTPGCYTPGGTEKSPTANDCPSCFDHPEFDMACAGKMASDGINAAFPVPHAVKCQKDAEIPGPCVNSSMAGVICC